MASQDSPINAECLYCPRARIIPKGDTIPYGNDDIYSKHAGSIGWLALENHDTQVIMGNDENCHDSRHSPKKTNVDIYNPMICMQFQPLYVAFYETANQNPGVFTQH